MFRLAILGTSGRDRMEQLNLSMDHMDYMGELVHKYIYEVLKTTCDKIILCSGGSAWAEHVAIRLYSSKKFGGLELYLATEFNKKRKKYKNTHEGRLMNMLHEKYREITGIDSLDELCSVISSPKVKIMVKRGFKQRNSLITQNSDHLIVHLFSKDTDSEIPTDKNIRHVWDRFIDGNKVCFILDYMPK